MGILFFMSACTKNLTQKNLLYSNDFETGELRGLEIYSVNGIIYTTMIEDFNGSKVLGRFNNNTIRIELNSIPTHNAINVEFTLNIHDKWDGIFLGATNRPDIWNMSVDGSSVLTTTFSNSPSNKQSYPNFYQSGTPFPPKSNSQDSALTGICALKGIAGGSSSYKIVKTFVHSGRQFTFQCNDALQPFNSLCLKSWSIDNLTITAIQY